MANTSVNSGISHKSPSDLSRDKAGMVESIRSRAYALYEARGREDGHDLENWLLAEKQIAAPASESSVVAHPQAATEDV
jgi:hypothetical protein